MSVTRLSDIQRNKMVVDMVKAINTTAGTGGDFLPEELADYFIEKVRQKNFCRGLFRSFNMKNKTRDIPKILGNAQVFYQATEGGDASETAFTSGTLQLVAKKFMSYMIVTAEVKEDAMEAHDMEDIVETQMIKAMAEAEEKAMLAGDTTHTATATSVATATETNWYQKDSRLAFNGIVTLAGDISGSLTNETRAANRVNGSGNEISSALIRQGMHNLGAYGRNLSDLVLIVDPWNGSELLGDSTLVTVDKYGNNATILTGEYGKLWGKIRVLVSDFIPSTYAVMLPSDNAVIGDRRKVKLVRDPQPRSDVDWYVISQRIAFDVEHMPALVQFRNLESAPTAS